MSAIPIPTLWYPTVARVAREAGGSDRRVDLLRSIVEYYENAIVSGLRKATPRSAVQTVERLFRENADTWNKGWELGLQLVSEMRRKDVVAPLRLPPDLKIRLRKLPPTARRDLRAALLLMGSLPEGQRGELPLGSIEEAREATAKAVADPMGARFLAVLQGVLVAGERGGVPARVVEALALALWRMLRQRAPEEMVEDAYWSAEAAEAEERSERVMPFRRTSSRGA